MEILNEYDLKSECWHKIDGYLNARLLSARLELEKNQTEQQSAFLRGRIQFIKQLKVAAGAEANI